MYGSEKVKRIYFFIYGSTTNLKTPPRCGILATIQVSQPVKQHNQTIKIIISILALDMSIILCQHVHRLELRKCFYVLLIYQLSEK